MKFTTAFSVVLAATGVTASTWLSKAAYNKWHETELERWLSDHDIPYPSPADRKDLENLIQKNWDDHAVKPYSKWNNGDLTAYLQAKGIEAKQGTEATTDSLLSQVQQYWYETEDSAQQSWVNVKDWILDTWTDSELKEFCDTHGIPVPQPRQRDTLLQKARSNYEAVAKKVGEASAYPGDWLYSTWTESDLKNWLDSHGVPAPQPTSRDKLIASVRRNSRLAYLKMQDQSASATASAQAAWSTVTDMLIDAWSESDLKAFCDKNGINVPQGTKVNELRALVRKNRAQIIGDTVSGKAASAWGAATSNAGNQYARATDSASLAAEDAFNKATDTWSDSRLKAYLDARGVPVPQASKSDDIRALVRKNQHKASTGWTAYTFDDFSVENLRHYLAANGDAAAKKIGSSADASRAELHKAAQSAYSSASSEGGKAYASATSYLAQSTGTAKQNVFDTWSESEIKAYLDSYGIPVPQTSTIDELRASARKQYNYFKYGTSSPSGTIFAQIEEGAKDAWNWVAEQLNLGASTAQQKAAEADAKARQKIKEEL